ncbi:ABC transporter permease [Murimonas intestini]|uniref:ABC transporter permease n=1 Tax=Murimonas intestini TaxID=1337051 RepID=UPI0011DCC10A|nr:ABC transporter permease subunit [Murimonas intestini]
MATTAKPGGIRRTSMAKRKMTLALFSMMIPGLIYLVINNYIPMAGLTIAFKKFDYSKGIWGSEWCGLSNFTYLFKTRDAFNIIRNTVLYNLVFIVLGTILAVTVAIMLNLLRGSMNKKIYQTVILIPYLISMVVVSYIVYGFLSQENGFLNSMIVSAGGESVSWYTQSKYWPFILTIVNLWKGFGYTSILYYATVIGIDSSLYEAATVDGAGRWKQIWHVTLPGLRGTIITMVLLNIGRMFYSDFGLFYQVPMRSGLISSVTDTIDVFVYKALTQLNDVGRASAAGFMQSVLGFILVFGANMIIRKVDEESALF